MAETIACAFAQKQGRAHPVAFETGCTRHLGSAIAPSPQQQRRGEGEAPV
jgi:hypothetical protein